MKNNGQLKIRSVRSGEDSQQMTDQRKRKRMISNRESAKRSRVKKQKHLDDLTVQVSQFQAENSDILANLSLVTRLRLEVEAENSVLVAQAAELSHRLQSLNEILSNMSPGNSSSTLDHDVLNYGDDDDFFNPWNFIPLGDSPHAFVQY